MTKIIMHGCNGRMGQVISGIVESDENAQIIAGIDIVNNKDNPYPVYTKIDDCKEDADVIIDFASAKAVDALLAYAVKREIPVVLCTTGLSEEQIAKTAETSRKIAVLRSANMSLGINMLMKLVQEAAKILAASGFDIEIVEKHHNQKLDAPSGTALALADSINEAMEHQYEYCYDRSGVRQKREKRSLAFRRCGEAQLWENMKLFLQAWMK